MKSVVTDQYDFWKNDERNENAFWFFRTVNTLMKKSEKKHHSRKSSSSEIVKFTIGPIEDEIKPAVRSWMQKKFK